MIIFQNNLIRQQSYMSYKSLKTFYSYNIQVNKLNHSMFMMFGICFFYGNIPSELIFEVCSTKDTFRL